MRIVIAQPAGEQVYFISNCENRTSLHEILVRSGVDLRDFEQVWVDDVLVDPTLSIDAIGLCEGSLISGNPPAKAPITGKDLCIGPDRSISWTLTMIGGPTCSQHFSLPSQGTVRIGRSDQAEITLPSPSVSWSHAIITVSNQKVFIVDDNSSNGTYINGQKIDADTSSPSSLHEDDVVNIGGICLLLHQHSDKTSGQSIATSPGGLIVFNRPPRPALPPHGQAVSVPAKKDPSTPARFSWISVIAPLVMAVAMVVMMGSLRYAAIALLSPLMAVGSWLEQKRRSRATNAENEEQYLADLSQASREISQAATCERQRARAQVPYPHELIESAKIGSEKLWQVRGTDEDFLTVNLGSTNQPFTPTTISYIGQMQERTQKLFNQAVINSCPKIVDLKGGPVGIWGPRNESLAIARSLVCQLSTLSGPADFQLGIFTDKARSEDWRFTSWLPHTHTGSTNPHERFIALDEASATTMLRNLRERLNHPNGGTMVLVVDDISLTQGKDCPLRDILEYSLIEKGHHKERRVSAIIIAPQAHQLPSTCHSVIEVNSDSEAALTIPSLSEKTSHITLAGISTDITHKWARMLARYDDPNAVTNGGGLPGLVHLFDLLGFDRTHLTAETIVDSWRKNTTLSVPLGVFDDGIYTFDLVKDGPHGLVGGTTGSGKSELLRSLVAGLASRVDPEHLTFILIDFKGGAAFASLDQLPHTIGTLSNLEPSLAYRALKALEAELAWRQQCFAKAGENIDNIDAYWASEPDQPMPRLLVVVDEFAQLAKEYPDVLSSLVAIGAVGRTLGVHMILATQRPAGVVNDDILANTNMRTALRVQSKEDSSNVIGVPLAASIGREQKGRAYIKLGEEDITAIQTALVTGVSGVSKIQDLFVDPIILGTPPPEHTITNDGEHKSDMDVLIEKIIAANDLMKFAPARKVWPDPLDEHVELLLTHAPMQSHRKQQVGISDQAPAVIEVALYDDPEHQCQYTSGWDIREGNLIIGGIPGSGTSSALSALALRIADTYSPLEADIVILDAATPSLGHVQSLEHVRGYAGPGTTNRELQARLLRYLSKELDRRTANPDGTHPQLFVLIDGLATLKDEYTEFDDAQLLQSFYQVWAKGPAMGIHCVATTTRFKSLPSAIDEVTSQKWLFHLVDSYDYSLAGISKDNVPLPVPGRFVSSLSGHHGHIALPEDMDTAINLLTNTCGITERPPLIQSLPTFVDPHDLITHVHLGSEPWHIPIGINESDLNPHILQAFSGEHILIAGPARSGKSTMLAAIHHLLSTYAISHGKNIKIMTCASRRSPLHQFIPDTVGHEDISTLIATARISSEPCVIIIDDAHQLSDTDKSLADVLAVTDPRILLVISGRNDDLRNQYGQWTNQLRKSRLGVLLVPHPDFDGDLLGVRIPRTAPISLSVGRGYACQNGVTSLIQGSTHQMRDS